MDDDKSLNWIVGISVTLLVFFAIVEVALIGASFIFADKIECNWLWCTFTTTRTEGSSHLVSSQDCYQNGQPINCSLINDIPEHWMRFENGTE